jgi:hypothetical protein
MMKLSKRNLVVGVSSLLILASFALFLNLVSTHYKHEVPYNPKGATPLSTIIQQYSMQKGPIEILPNEVVYIDQSANIGDLVINGQLHCDDRAPNDIEIKATSISVNGVFQCGTQAKRYLKKLTISLKHKNVDPRTNSSYRGIVVNANGKLIITGQQTKSGWYRLAETAYPGDTTIQIRPKSPHSKFAWQVGDKIAIGPTSFNYEEAESFTIVGINKFNPYEIHLDHPIQHRHWGETQEFQSESMGTVVLDESAEVANLTRNILIRSDESLTPISEADTPDAQLGGHVMVNRYGFAAIDSVEFYRMGTAGIMARYPFHWHLLGDAPGQFIKNSSVHRSFQRCITVHRTNKTLVHNNVCFDFKGHGYFFEDGTEINNVMTNNLGIMAKPPSQSKILLASDNLVTGDNQGRFPSVSIFWVSHPYNTLTGNIASGSVGTGFWMSFEPFVMNLQGTEQVAWPLTSNTKIFSHNIAHANKVGFTWDGAASGPTVNPPNPNNPNDRQLQQAEYTPSETPIFNNLTAFKNLHTGVYFRSKTTVLKNLIVADNGWSLWNGYNQIVRDSVIIGRTNNQSEEIDSYYYNQGFSSRWRKTGVILYDGPFEVHNTDFLDFSTEYEDYRRANNQLINSTVVPFTSVGGSKKYTNVTSGLRFSPEPIYRAHLYDPVGNGNVHISHRSYLGASTIRDLDGTLSNTIGGRLIVGGRSMSAAPAYGCVSGGESLYNFKVCPAKFSENYFVFSRWGDNPWATSFIVARNDGVFSFPKSEWTYMRGVPGYQIPHNTFTMPNSTQYEYELLPRYDYKHDKDTNAWLRVTTSTEREHPQIPVVKIVAYGKNCHLLGDAQSKSSLAQLRAATTTSYFSEGENFYVKIYPTELLRQIVPGPHGVGRAYDTEPKHAVSCDDASIPHRVIGNIESAITQGGSTTIKGWACNYKHDNPIQVKLYAVPKVYFGQKQQAPTLIGQYFSNQTSNERISFDCGTISTSGRRFNFTIPTATLQQYTNHQFVLRGISNTSNQEVVIPGVTINPFSLSK